MNNYRIDKSIPSDGNCFFFVLARALRSTLPPEQVNDPSILPALVQNALKKVAPTDYERVVTSIIPKILNNLKVGREKGVASRIERFPDSDVEQKENNELLTVAALRFIVSKEICTQDRLAYLKEQYLEIEDGARLGLEEWRRDKQNEIASIDKQLN